MTKKRAFYLCKNVVKTSAGEEINTSPIVIWLKKSEARCRLYHYTNVDALLKILTTKRFKFSRIDRVNDPLERLYLQDNDMYRRIFVSCFNHSDSESIPLWKVYTQKGLGVRLGLFFCEDNIQNHFVDHDRTFLDSSNKEIDWLNNRLGQAVSGAYFKINDVLYTNDRIFGSSSKEGEYIDFMPDLMGITKSPIWEYEDETRLVLCIVNDEIENHDYDCVYVPFDTKQLEHIEIRFDPWMSDELISCLQFGIKHSLENDELNVLFVASELKGRIV